MNYNIVVTSNFEKEAKRLSKKYVSLKDELKILERNLISKPDFGTPIGKGAFKIRVAVKTKGKGSEAV